MPSSEMPAENPTPSEPRPPRTTLESAADAARRSLDGTARAEEAADLLIPLAPVDLRHIPKQQWREYLLRDVVIPPDCAVFVEGQTEFKREELDRLEDRIASYYGVTEPFYITAESTPIFHAWLGGEK
jgi:hypothetical protein